MLRSGTSVGANVREAKNAESKRDFIHKMGIAQKEADESLYFLELLYATDYINYKEFNSIYTEAEEVYKIIKSIIITAKKNLEKKKWDMNWELVWNYEVWIMKLKICKANFTKLLKQF